MLPNPQHFSHPVCLCKLKMGDGCCILSGVDRLRCENEVGCCWLEGSFGDTAESEALWFREAAFLFVGPPEGPAGGPSPLQEHSQQSISAIYTVQSLCLVGPICNLFLGSRRLTEPAWDHVNEPNSSLNKQCTDSNPVRQHHSR